MDHNKLGYPDGDGPGNERIQLASDDKTLRRWTPVIVIREDNQTCITTNVSGENGLMKELERAFGVYVSWNCARLASGDYVIYYTRSHDMAADICTKGFNDVALYSRLLLLTNMYSPDQWKKNILRPPPLLGDRSSAIGSEGFDSTATNSQLSVLSAAQSAKQEDNRKPIKKNAEPKKMASFGGILCPQLDSSGNAYRTDLGVYCFQLPPDAPDGTSRLTSCSVVGLGAYLSVCCGWTRSSTLVARMKHY